MFVISREVGASHPVTALGRKSPIQILFPASMTPAWLVGLVEQTMSE
jgi:hypothetical protein